MEMEKEMEERLKNLSWVTNRRMEQLKFLFEVCDKDFDKLLALEAALKKYFVSATPTTKEQVDYMLTEDEVGVDPYEKRMGMLGYAKNKVGLHIKVELP